MKKAFFSSAVLGLATLAWGGCLGDLSLLGAPCDSNDDCGAFICKIEEGKIKGVCALDDGSGGNPEPLDPDGDGAGGNGDSNDAGSGGGANACSRAINQFDNPGGDESGPQITLTNVAWDPVYDNNCTAQSIGLYAYDVFFDYDDYESDAFDAPATDLFEFALPNVGPPGRSALISINPGHTARAGSYEWTVCVDDHPSALAGRYKDDLDNWSAVSCFDLE